MRPAHQDSISLPWPYVDRIATVTKKSVKLASTCKKVRHCDFSWREERRDGWGGDEGLAQGSIVAWQQLSTFAK